MLLTSGNDLPDRAGAESALLGWSPRAAPSVTQLGGDALWTLPGGQRVPRLDLEGASASV